ncbi:hypothetical protein [Legionella brunensis]|uniref:Uncharacterized protein n=1 Tax=Legionella brunensis TaxID=29422 RepID=A0A0W0S4R5_9GAMM|nr:hypothetical protein [Legionella brunensis]KTC78362.1 hypothetical protein Lbru_2654 [Legionella brunensis]
MEIKDLILAIDNFNRSVWFWERDIKRDPHFLMLKEFSMKFYHLENRDLAPQEMLLLFQIIADCPINEKEQRIGELFKELNNKFPQENFTLMTYLHSRKILNASVFNALYKKKIVDVDVSMRKIIPIMEKNKLLNAETIDSLCAVLPWISSLYTLLLFFDNKRKLNAEIFKASCTYSYQSSSILNSIRDIVDWKQFLHYFIAVIHQPNSIAIFQLLSRWYKLKKFIPNQKQLSILLNSESFQKMNDLDINDLSLGDINLIFDNPIYSRQIFEILQDSSHFFKDEKTKAYMIKNVIYWDSAMDALALVSQYITPDTQLTSFFLHCHHAPDLLIQLKKLREFGLLKRKNSCYQPLVTTLLNFPKYAQDTTDIFITLSNYLAIRNQPDRGPSEAKNGFESYLNKVYKEPHNIPNVALALRKLEKEGITNKKGILLIFSHDFSSTHEIVDLLILLNKSGISSLEDAREVLEKPKLLDIVKVLFNAGLLNQTVFSALLRSNPSAPILELSKPQKTGVFLQEMERINHPFCHYLLGKIYCGELWGIDRYFNLKKAWRFLNKVPSSFPWKEEVSYSLFNITFQKPQADENRHLVASPRLAFFENPGAEVLIRTKQVLELMESQHPLAPRIKHSYLFSSYKDNDEKAQALLLRMSKTPRGYYPKLFDLFAEADLVTKVIRTECQRWFALQKYSSSKERVNAEKESSGLLCLP